MNLSNSSLKRNTRIFLGFFVFFILVIFSHRQYQQVSLEIQAANVDYAAELEGTDQDTTIYPVEDLESTVLFQGGSGFDAGDIGAYAWKKDTNPLMLLNIPFNTGASQQDFSGNIPSVNGSVVNGASYDASGLAGGAISLDGTNYIDFGDAASLELTPPFTISAWTKLDVLPSDLGAGNHQSIVSKYVSSGNQREYRLAVMSYNRYQYALSSDGSSGAFVSMQSNDVIDVGDVSVWRHILVTHDTDGTVNMYIDGAFDNTANLGDTIFAGTAPFQVGNFDSNLFQGDIDEVQIYNQVLPTQQIQQIYNDGNTNNAGAPTILHQEYLDLLGFGDYTLEVTPINSSGTVEGTTDPSNTVEVLNPYSIELANGNASQFSVQDADTQVSYLGNPTGFNGSDSGAYVWKINGINQQFANVPFNVGTSSSQMYNYARQENARYSVSAGNLLTDGDGVVGPYINFNGVSGAEFPNNTSFTNDLIALDSGSISLWYRSTESSSDPIILFSSVGKTAFDSDIVDVTVGNVSYIGGATESISFRVRRGGSNRLVMYATGGATRLKDGNWHHIVIATGDGDNRIYIDGEREDVIFNNGNASTVEFMDIELAGSGVAQVSFAYQRLNSTNTYYQFQLDEFQIWETAIDDQLVLRMFEEGEAGIASPSSFPDTQFSAGQTVALDFYSIPLTDEPDFVTVSSNIVSLTQAPGDVCALEGDGGTITSGDATYDGIDLYISGCSFTIDGSHDFASLTVKSGGVLSHSQASANKTILTIEGDIEVASGAQINLDAKGYLGGTQDGNLTLDGLGPGGGGGAGLAGCSGCAGGGGSYGGKGGDAAIREVIGTFNDGDPGNVYGEYDTFDDFGSGGGAGKNTSEAAEGDGGNGGGFIEITCSACTNTITVNGLITANGGDGSSNGARSSGAGGSGGGIRIKGGEFSGSGIIQASGGFPAGGVGGTNTGGNGGGGRIRLEAEQTAYTSGLTIQALSGTSTRSQYGGPGSIYIVNPDNSSVLTIDAQNLSPIRQPDDPGNLKSFTLGLEDNHVIATTLDDIEISIQNDAYVTVQDTITNSELTIDDAYVFSETDQEHSFTTLTIENSSTFDVHPRVNGVNDYAFYAQIDSLTLDAASIITANERGFRGAGVNGQGTTGEGAGGGAPPPGGGDQVGAGGAHGGQATQGLADSAFANSLGTTQGTYGDLLNPLTFGSGGGLGGDGGNGGGLIHITCASPCSSTLTINGTISANGGDGASDARSRGGGGAGGSINISAGTITGSGTISANGGTGPGSASANTGGSGGGGRILVDLEGGSLPGTITLESFGGAGTLADPAAAGTIYIIENNATFGDFIVDNNRDDSSVFTPLITNDGPSSVSVLDLSVINEADLLVDSPCVDEVLSVFISSDFSGNGVITNNQVGTCSVFISQPPNIPTLVAPQDGGNLVISSPQLSIGYSDPDTGDTGTIDIRLSTTSTADCISNGAGVFETGVSSQSSSEIADVEYTISSTLVVGTTYYWCARTNDGYLTSDSGNFTEMGSFIVIAGGGSSRNQQQAIVNQESPIDNNTDEASEEDVQNNIQEDEDITPEPSIPEEEVEDGDPEIPTDIEEPNNVQDLPQEERDEAPGDNQLPQPPTQPELEESDNIGQILDQIISIEAEDSNQDDQSAQEPTSRETGIETTSQSDGRTFTIEVEDQVLEEELIVTGVAQTEQDRIEFTGNTSQPGATVTLIFNGGVTVVVTSDENGFWQTFVSAEQLGIQPGQSQQVQIEAIAAKNGLRSELVSVGGLTLSLSPDEQVIAEFQTITSNSELVSDLQAISKQFVEIIEDQEVVIQRSLTITAPVVIASSAPLWGYLPYIPTLMYHFITYLLGLLGRRRQEEDIFGTVYDTITKKPLGLAVLRVYKKLDNNKEQLITTKVTDKLGRYDLLLEPGEYRIEAKKPQYNYPSKIESFNPIVAITSDHIFTPNIPLDPVDVVKRFQLANIFKKFWIMFQRIGHVLALPVLFAGSMVSSLTVISVPENFENWILAPLYILLFFLQLRLRPVIEKAWGVVYDLATSAVLPLTTIQLIDPQYGKVVMSRLTDYQGRFAFLPEPGKYLLKASKQGYEQAEVIESNNQEFNPLGPQNIVAIQKEGERIQGDIAMKML